MFYFGLKFFGVSYSVLNSEPMPMSFDGDCTAALAELERRISERSGSAN